MIYLPNFTAVGKYKKDINPIKNDLEQWSANYDLFEWKANLTYTSDGINIIETYNLILEFIPLIGLSTSDVKSDELTEYKNFGKSAGDLANQGRVILDVLSLASPPTEYASAHDQIVKCIRFRIQILDNIALSITNLKTIDLSSKVNSSSYSDCFSYDASIEKIMSLVGKKK